MSLWPHRKRHVANSILHPTDVQAKSTAEKANSNECHRIYFTSLERPVCSAADITNSAEGLILNTPHL